MGKYFNSGAIHIDLLSLHLLFRNLNVNRVLEKLRLINKES